MVADNVLRLSLRFLALVMFPTLHWDLVPLKTVHELDALCTVDRSWNFLLFYWGNSSKASKMSFNVNCRFLSARLNLLVCSACM